MTQQMINQGSKYVEAWINHMTTQVSARGEMDLAEAYRRITGDDVEPGQAPTIEQVGSLSPAQAKAVIEEVQDLAFEVWWSDQAERHDGTLVERQQRAWLAGRRIPQQ